MFFCEYWNVLRTEVWNFIQKRLQTMSFSVNIANFLRTPILEKICERLLLRVSRSYYLSERQRFVQNFIDTICLKDIATFNHFNCFIIFKDTKIQWSHLVFKILLYFLYLLITRLQLPVSWAPLLTLFESSFSSSSSKIFLVFSGVWTAISFIIIKRNIL